MQVPIEISARHVHLSCADQEKLFGAGYKMNILKNLSQPGQYASAETVKLIGPKGEIEKVRVLGPCRQETQVELSETEARALGLEPPVRDSGNLENTPGLKVIGQKGELDLPRGVILALRHIHIDPPTAETLGVKNGDRVKVDTKGVRDMIFENVLIRVSPNFKLAMHIDTDEANAAGIDAKNHFGEILV